MLGSYKDFVESELGNIRLAGLWKPERILDTPQRPEARIHGGADVLVLCANNYLGLADNPQVISAARDALMLLDRHGVLWYTQPPSTAN